MPFASGTGRSLPHTSEPGTVASLARLMGETKYSRAWTSYNIAWLCLDKEEQEAAMVYMLGRVPLVHIRGHERPAPRRRLAVVPEGARSRVPRLPPHTVEVRDLIRDCFGKAGARSSRSLCGWRASST